MLMPMLWMEAWVDLRVQLGQTPGHLHHQQPQTVFKDTLSRQRHRARRVAGQTAES